MPKQGPCCHCGITSTPLWRNGPPGKPVLCNACGSRWRTKGTLANYAPLHSRGIVFSDIEVRRNSNEHISSSIAKPESLFVKSENDGDIEYGETASVNESSALVYEDDKSNRSSSGSRLSFSESTVLAGSIDGKEFSGTVQSDLWDPHLPSRKREIERCQSPSPVEKLRRDLFNILQEEGSSSLSGYSEEVLLFQREDQMLSVETKLGSVLIKQPASMAEEKSESNSCLKGTQLDILNDASSPVFLMPSQSCEVSSNGKCRLILESEEEEMEHHPVKRRALADISSGNIFMSNINVRESGHSTQRSTDLVYTKGQDFKLEKEILPCSSQIIGSATSLPAKKQMSRLHQASRVMQGGMKNKNYCYPSLQIRKAYSSANVAFRKGLPPSEMKDRVQIAQPCSNTNVSASSINKSSAVLDMMEEYPLSSGASQPH